MLFVSRGSQGIDHSREIVGGDRAVKEPVDQTVLFRPPHLVRQLRLAHLIYHQRHPAAGQPLPQPPAQVQPLFQPPRRVGRDLCNKNIGMGVRTQILRSGSFGLVDPEP